MNTLDQLKALSSAEEFFAFLGAPYDPEALGVARLHILKRMGQSLAQADFSKLDDSGVRAAARQMLIEAYRDLVAAGPLGARLFKVLQDRDPARPAKARGKSFVALSDIGVARRGATS